MGYHRQQKRQRKKMSQDKQTKRGAERSFKSNDKSFKKYKHLKLSRYNEDDIYV